jgi:RNA polymerase sigma factor (sigma-70 family)
MTAKEFCKQVLPLQDKIFRLAKKFFNSVDDADDAVQEVFHKLWTRKEDIDSFKSLEAFALIVTRNHCLDTIKAKKHHVTQLNLEHDI